MNSRKFNFILILAGGAIALYANAEDEQEVYILLIGIVILMFGLYRLSRGISDIKTNSDKFSKIEEEEKEEK